MSCHSDGDGALMLFGSLLGIIAMLGLNWLISLEGKHIT